MRIGEAQAMLGVLAARQGDVDRAIAHDRHALVGDRKSVTSLDDMGAA
jgi:hypothetical protein